MKSNRTAKIPNGVSVMIGFADEDLSGLEWNIGEWSESDMYIFLSDKGSKDFIKRLVENKNFFLFTQSYYVDEGEEYYYDKDTNVYYVFRREYRRDGEPYGNIALSIDPDDQAHWWEDGVENGYDLILRQYLALNTPFINWINNPWGDKK
jgi:hypothetical protein